MERQRALVGPREARGGGSDVAPVMPAAGEVPTGKRQAPARGAPYAARKTCPARIAHSLWETASTRRAASGSGQRGAGVMDDGRGRRDPGSAGRGLWAGGGRALGREGVFPYL